MLFDGLLGSVIDVGQGKSGVMITVYVMFVLRLNLGLR